MIKNEKELKKTKWIESSIETVFALHQCRSIENNQKTIDEMTVNWIESEQDHMRERRE